MLYDENIWSAFVLWVGMLPYIFLFSKKRLMEQYKVNEKIFLLDIFNTFAAGKIVIVFCCEGCPVPESFSHVKHCIGKRFLFVGKKKL